MTEVPRSLDQLTPAWLSGALRAEVATAELTAIAGAGPWPPRPGCAHYAGARVDNLFFGGDSVIALDCQAIALGEGPYDLVDFFGVDVPDGDAPTSPSAT